MSEAKFAYQIWNGKNQIVKDGIGNAGTLDRFAEIIKATYIKNSTLFWTVWERRNNKIYLEYQGSKLIDQGE